MVVEAVERADPRNVEYCLCQLSFLHFLSHYVYINDPPPGAGRIQWVAWPHLSALAKELPSQRRLVILKARQLGLSWLVAAYALWRAMFAPGATVLLLSRGQLEASELLDKVKFVFDNLPDFQPVATKRNESILELGGLNSRVFALPSTEDAGTGFTATLVVCDEHAKHPYAASNFAAVEPTVNAGAQFISLSTASGIGNFYHQLYTAAKSGLNGFAWRFMGALTRPGRDMAWHAETRRNYEGAPHLFAGEYPLNDVEAFVLTSGVPVFDLLALERLLRSVSSPQRFEQYPLGSLSVYQEPTPGRRYVCGADVAYGLDTPDCGVAQVVDWQTGLHVASLWGHFPPEDLAQRTVELCRRYNGAFLGLEANGVGKFALRRIEDLGYADSRHLYHSDWDAAAKRGDMPKSPGWSTDTKTRPVLVAELAEAIAHGSLITQDAETIGELRTFIHEAGKPQAAQGCHDDRVMALGIAWQMRAALPSGRTMLGPQVPRLPVRGPYGVRASRR